LFLVLFPNLKGTTRDFFFSPSSAFIS